MGKREPGGEGNCPGNMRRRNLYRAKMRNGLMPKIAHHARLGKYDWPEADRRCAEGFGGLQAAAHKRLRRNREGGAQSDE